MLSMHSYMVAIKGVSKKNEDGISRQKIIKSIKVGDKVFFNAEPTNPHDRWAVSVFTMQKRKIGFLPSDARDASTVLKGEPIRGTIVGLRGGTNWFYRFFLRKKYIGVVVKLEKGQVDWERFNELSKKVKPLDDAVRKALDLDKLGNGKNAIDAYKVILMAINKFNVEDRYASAHRKCIAPIDRLTFLLENEKRYDEIKDIIENFINVYDPLQPNKKERETIIERYHRILELVEK